MFELRYDTEYSDEEYEYYDVYNNDKPYYKNKTMNCILSLEIDRRRKTMHFINITDEIIDEILLDRQELYLLILSLYDELNIEGYRVIGDDLLSNELKDVIELNML